jgi:hypothetical protein
MTSYLAKHRTYYYNHKDEILAKEREKKRWLTYYESHKDEIKERREARKQRRQGLNNVSPETLAQILPNIVDMFLN